MINGVLVERTVKDVIPALQTNSEGLKKVLVELVKQYKRQEEEMEKWKVSQHLMLLFLLLVEESFGIIFAGILHPKLGASFSTADMNILTQKSNNIQVVQQ